MRADARRNQVRILDAARLEITEAGSDVSMDQIAKTAGVAVGTLYRHYPTKRDLVQAVLSEFGRSLVVRATDAADLLTEPGDGMAQITRLLSEFVEEAATNQAIKAAANVFGADYGAPEVEDEGRRAVRALISAAIADGDLRSTVTESDFYLLLSSAPAGLPKEARERWLDIMLAGITRESTD